MNLKQLLISAAIVILGGAWYWWSNTHIEPIIAVVSPVGGESWQPGEVHTISWRTSGIPASDKISMTIRRVPPPPLQQEGQEFDPIVAVDLPNTGSTSWKISPMYPNGTYIIGLHAYTTMPAAGEVTAESKEFSLVHPVLSADLYPLYTAVDWYAPEVESFDIGSTSYTGASMFSAPVTDTMDPSSVFTPFTTYYDGVLKGLGWSEVNELAAGGHAGGQAGYRKGGRIVLTRFHVDYHTLSTSSPSECPCDVTLSLFSSEPK